MLLLFFFIGCKHSTFIDCVNIQARPSYKEKIQNFESFLLEQKLLSDDSIESILSFVKELEKKEELLKFSEIIHKYDKEPFGPTDIGLIESCCRSIELKGKPILLCEAALQISESGVTLNGISRFGEALSREKCDDIYCKGMLYCMLFFLALEEK